MILKLLRPDPSAPIGQCGIVHQSLISKERPKRLLKSIDLMKAIASSHDSIQLFFL